MIEKVLPGAGGSCVAWAPDGRLLATNGRLWDTRTWEVVVDLHHPHPHRMSFSRDGAVLFIFSYPGSRGDLVQAWDVASGCMLWGYSSRDDHFPVNVDPLGRYISLESSTVITFIDAATGKVVSGKEIRVDCLAKYSYSVIQIGSVASCSFSADGKQMYILVDALPRLLVADVETCEILEDTVFVEGGVSAGTPFTPDELRLVEAGKEDSPLVRERFDEWIHLKPSFDGRWLACWNTNGITYFLTRRANSWQIAHRFDGVPNPSGRGQLYGWIQASAWSPDSRFLARAHVGQGRPGFVSIVEASSGAWQVVGIFSHEEGGVNDVAFSPDGQRLASIGTDNTCRIWQVPQFPLSRTYRGSR